MNVILAGGGTGGHIFPLLSIGKALKKKAPYLRLYFVGGKDSLEEKLAKKDGFTYLSLIKQSNRRDPLGLVGAVFLLFMGFIQCLFLFLHLRPRLLIGSGGYVSLPAIASAYVLGIPYFLLEQNIIPGKVTRLFSPKARAIMTTFPGTELSLKGKVILTGNPLREEIKKREQAREELEIGNSFLLFIAGGSKDSRAINEEMYQIIPALLSYNSQVMIYWLTGEEAFEQIRRDLPGSDRLIIKDFDYQAPSWLSASDLYIGRAGGGFLTEALASGVPSILIPYPQAADEHQLANAQLVSEAGAGLVLPEARIKELGDIIEKLLNDQDLLSQMRERALAFPGKNATSSIVDLILEELNG